MQIVRTIAAVIGVALLAFVAYQQADIISNQRAQMRQQFHSDGIALAQLLGDEGLKNLMYGREDIALTPKESFAVSILLQRFLIVQKDIRHAYTEEEQALILKECERTMKFLPIQKQWAEEKRWYSPQSRAVIDACLPKP